MAFKVCPICGTRTHSNATVCPTCGTSLAAVKASNGSTRGNSTRQYEDQFGETDLLESRVRSRGETILFAGVVVLIATICMALIILPIAAITSQAAASGNETATAAAIQTLGLPPTALTSPPVVLATNTQRPTLSLPTVTPAPPTPTPLPTEGPCEVQVQSGDDLISLAYSCGHRSMDVLPLILEMNNLASAESLQAGQTLLIPRPTVEGASPEQESTTEGESGSENTSLSQSVAAAEPELTLTPTLYPSATLLPGLMWHVVEPNDSMIAIMYEYHTSAEVLSQLNPEVAFSQCDFQYDTGGESCTVFLQPGQMFRVPAPTPTATLSPTLSGSETATPTITPTYNAPSALSPNNRAVFQRDEIVTLRWQSTGVLAPGEVYRINVTDLTSGASYSTDTAELYFIVPQEWQGTDERRHEYEWTVSVFNPDQPDMLMFTTAPRTFSWEGRQIQP